MLLPTLKKECSHFLNEMNGIPLTKHLPSKGDGFRKVKVRQRTEKTKIDKVFNKTFSDVYKDLRNRAVFCYADGSLSDIPEGQEEFYIFPINGYQYIYAEEIPNSIQFYEKTLRVLIDHLSIEKSQDILSDIFEISYSSTNLHKAINAKSEILIYNISHFYAIRKSLIEDYTTLFSKIA